MKKIFLSALKKIAPVLLLSTAMQASAAIVTTIHTGHGTGTLDGVAFDADFAITAIADTSTITSFGGTGLSNDNLSATIYIDSLGVFNFITPTRYFVNGVIGFSHAGVDGNDLLNGPAGTWDMASSLEPVIGTGEFLQWMLSDVVTTGGVLVFNDGTTPSAFTATVSEVPVPAGIWLFGSGLVGLVGIARRKA